jgi:hypothetical protein
MAQFRVLLFFPACFALPSMHPFASAAAAVHSEPPLRDVPLATAQAQASSLRAQALKTRPKNTASSYGNVTDLSSGPAREWKTWCAAGPCEVVYGLATPESKVVYDTIVTPNKKMLYLDTHLSKRPQLSSNLVPKAGTVAGVSTIKQHAKMLSDLHIQQSADQPEAVKGIAAPRTASAASLLATEGRKQAQRRKDYYADPGKAHNRVLPAWDEGQYGQITEYGMCNSAPGPDRNKNEITPRVRLESLLGNVCLFRNDSAHRLGLTAFFIVYSFVGMSTGTKLLILSQNSMLRRVYGYALGTTNTFYTGKINHQADRRYFF